MDMGIAYILTRDPWLDEVATKWMSCHTLDLCAEGAGKHI